MSASKSRALRVLLGIGGHGDFDVAVPLLDARNEVGGTLVAVGMGWNRCAPMPPAGSPRRADDVADADLVIAVDDLVDLPARGADAGQMCGRQQRGFPEDAGDGRMGALAGRAAGAVGHGDEFRVERGEPVDGLPEIALHLFRLGRKELEGDCRPLRGEVPFEVPVFLARAGVVRSVMAPLTPRARPVFGGRQSGLDWM